MTILLQHRGYYGYVEVSQKEQLPARRPAQHRGAGALSGRHRDRPDTGLSRRRGQLPGLPLPDAVPR